MNRILNKKTISWCLYDWSSSAYFTNVITFILSVYFVKSIAIDEITGLSHWAYASGFAALMIAITSPVLGAKIDRQGSSRAWFISLNIIAITCTFAWWWVTPEYHSSPILALLLLVASYVSAEIAFILYNGMLKDIAPPSHIGRISAWGYALGYAGGVVCLLLMLFVLIKNVFNIPFLDTGYQGIRSVGPVTALWFLLFSLPIFMIKSPNSNRTKTVSVRESLRLIGSYLKSLKHDKTLLKFLVARLFFIDGLNTIFALAGIYAAELFGMSETRILYFAVSSQLFALIGAAIFAKLDDKIGPLACLKINVFILAGCVLAIFMIHTEQMFWIFGMLLGTTIGPIQSCGRSYITRISNHDSVNKNFGLYAMSGKVTAFLGPWLAGLTAEITHNQRLSLLPVLALIVIGFLILLFVGQPKTVRD